eukprot:1149258-Pelagomonas_calceolata.AAC.2
MYFICHNPHGSKTSSPTKNVKDNASQKGRVHHGKVSICTYTQCAKMMDLDACIMGPHHIFDA